MQRLFATIATDAAETLVHLPVGTVINVIGHAPQGEVVVQWEEQTGQIFAVDLAEHCVPIIAMARDEHHKRAVS